MAKPVVTVAHWQIPAESRATVLALVADLAAHSLAEPGCLGYEVLHSADAPDELVLVERYTDRAALEAHTGSPHYQELVARQIRPLLTNRQVHILEPVDLTRSTAHQG